MMCVPPVGRTWTGDNKLCKQKTRARIINKCFLLYNTYTGCNFGYDLVIYSPKKHCKMSNNFFQNKVKILAGKTSLLVI